MATSSAHEVTGLLHRAEDHAGGLMGSRHARLRPESTVEEAITCLRRLRRQTREEVELLVDVTGA